MDLRHAGICPDLEGRRSGHADLDEWRSEHGVIAARGAAAARLAVAAVEPWQRVIHAGEAKPYPGPSARREKDRDQDRCQRQSPAEPPHSLGTAHRTPPIRATPD